MRTGYFYSLIFAFLTSASIAAIAAPVAPAESPKAPLVMDTAAGSQSAKVDLNDAGAATPSAAYPRVGQIAPLDVRAGLPWPVRYQGNSERWLF